jgi:hypothetical protein
MVACGLPGSRWGRGRWELSDAAERAGPEHLGLEA